MTDQNSLPLPDYDQLPEGAIESRVRTLDAEGVERLLKHEREHANRPRVVMMLEHRLQALRSGAEPSGGSPLAETPEAPGHATGSSDANPDQQGPPVNPPSQGVPTNPSQPRS